MMKWDGTRVKRASVPCDCGVVVVCVPSCLLTFLFRRMTFLACESVAMLCRTAVLLCYMTQNMLNGDRDETQTKYTTRSVNQLLDR